MNWIIDNWYVVVGLIVMVAFGVIDIYYFIKLPNATKIKNVKELLKYLVVEAEKELGSGTGQLKLRYVYDMACAKFDWLVKLVPFSTFSEWVDEALEWMNAQLENNKNVRAIVQGD